MRKIPGESVKLGEGKGRKRQEDKSSFQRVDSTSSGSTCWGRPQPCRWGTAWAAPPQGLRASALTILCCVALSCAIQLLSSIPGLYPLDVNSTATPRCHHQQQQLSQPKMSPDTAKCPRGRGNTPGREPLLWRVSGAWVRLPRAVQVKQGLAGGLATAIQPERTWSRESGCGHLDRRMMSELCLGLRAAPERVW